ncbi:MAG: glycogen/starch synthase, partial [Sedimentisphaerales bacterium]|nr:glycogen/starch synthase [Sedimentisphaerales bacterium]
MKIFMLGWEFPPFISGGLGTACYGLTKAMDQMGLDVIFVLPRSVKSQNATHVKMLTPSSALHADTVGYFLSEELKRVSFRFIESSLKPYVTPRQYQSQIEDAIKKKRASHKSSGNGHTLFGDAVGDIHYHGDMYTEVHRYAAVAAQLAINEQFDIIHAHDWMTYPAAIAAAAITGKPLVVQVHSTEFDRSGEHVNQVIYDIERKGMHAADRIIAVSHLTRNIIISRYGVPGEKV